MVTVAIVVVLVFIAVALLAAGGAFDRTRRVVTRRDRVVEPAPRRVVVEEAATERIVERP